jgi:hypothetical protein
MNSAKLLSEESWNVTILRVGATQQYSDNFENAFGRKKSAGKKSAGKAAARKVAKKKPAAKKK